MAIVFDTPRDLTPAEISPGMLRRLGSFRKTAHLMSSLPGEAGHRELVTFARKIGLKLEWIQHEGGPLEHFDLFDTKIAAAAVIGAKEITSRELALVMRARREAMPDSVPCPCKKCVENRQRLSQRQETEAPTTDKPPLVAVTLWAPWAFAVAWLGKDVENRLWRHAQIPRWLIGRQLAIHAGNENRWSGPGWDTVIEVLQEIYPDDWRARLVAGFLRFLPDETRPLTMRMILSEPFRRRCCSRIVAVSKVSDILPIDREGLPRMNGWHATDHEGIKLEGTVSLPIGVPCSGTVTPVFWTVPDDVVKATRLEYRAAVAGAVPEKIALPPVEPRRRRSSSSPEPEETDQLNLNL